MIKVYALLGYEDTAVLLHEKEFTQEEFDIMCKEAPVYKYANARIYNSGNIALYLIETYGFLDLKYKAEFNVDAEVE